MDSSSAREVPAPFIFPMFRRFSAAATALKFRPFLPPRFFSSSSSPPTGYDPSSLNGLSDGLFSSSNSIGQLVGGEKVGRSSLLLVDERDLVENFARGGGRGGQAVATTANCVRLRHLPTGTIVRCHATRSLEQNRLIARKILRERLEELALGPESSRQRKAEKIRKQKDRKRRRRESKNKQENPGEPKELKTSTSRQEEKIISLINEKSSDSPLSSSSSSPSAPPRHLLLRHLSAQAALLASLDSPSALAKIQAKKKKKQEKEK